MGYTHFVASNLDRLFVIRSAVFSRDRSSNLATKARLNDENIILYDDYKDLIDHARDDGVDLLLILTPPDLHFKIIGTAIECDLPIICEKPLCANPREMSILSTIMKPTSFLAVTYNYAFYPFVQKMKSLIKTGAIGDILHIRASMPQETFLRNRSLQNWRLKDSEIPTLSFDLGTHLNHLLAFLLGVYPISAFATSSSYAHSTAGGSVIDSVSAILTYCDFVAEIFYSKVALGHQNGLNIEIYGSKASLKWVQMNPNELQLRTLEGEVVVLNSSSRDCGDVLGFERFKPGHPQGYIEAFANLYKCLFDAFSLYKSGGDYQKLLKETCLDFDFARHDMAILMGFVDSASSGVKINLKEDK